MRPIPTKSLMESSFGMFYYSTPNEGIGGKIRTSPEDFIVEEITPEGIIVNEDLKALDRGHGKVTLAVLKKISKPLLPIISMLEKKLGGRIRFAGIKDRRAVTYQLVSINRPFEGRLKIGSIELWSVGRSMWEIYPGELSGNRFTITIRNLENFPEELSIKWFPNYFGHQRFGISRPNTHKIGKMLIKRDFEGAIKEFLAELYEGDPHINVRKKLRDTWDLKGALSYFSDELIYEKKVINALIHGSSAEGALYKLSKQLLRLFIEAYQSYIFNLALSERWKRFGLFNIKIGDYIAMLNSHRNPSKPIEIVKENLVKMQKLVEQGRAVLLMPIPGSNIKFKGINEEIYSKILYNEGIEPKDFSIFEISLRGTFRPAVFYPMSFELMEISKDEKFEGKIKAIIRFSLPRGTYATILLRELMKPEDPKKTGF
ncbi:MAG: tRNA pseudouridine(13) synthase TruD [Candidatus Methanomethyliaceae archaeon]|nr:tRNA pseudouridine(13) synthase TruD [Candidatus Methanomethyliaceae archaeon]MDW7970657.1 tRNA pseudouridine(13) synthase TruD [Nitrososphaerota archaeon]